MKLRRLVWIVLALLGPFLFAEMPVAGLREYNGTYTGVYGTGSTSYSVLYRDNYDGGSNSGCNGEGCGKHPGVDIPVPSGTPVVAAFSGRIVRSECNEYGWGGLVVVESQNPYNWRELVYQTYGHLRRRLVDKGQEVREGDRIGDSGGRQGVDSCAGNSTGAHLHFQVDKEHPGFTPWYPTGRVDNPDNVDFEVMRYTYNPIPFIIGGYRWGFSKDNFSEYWLPVNVEQFQISRGAYQMVSGNDPRIWRYHWVPCEFNWDKPCTGAIAAEASLYQLVVVEMDLACVSNPVQIYFITDSDPVWDENKSVSFNYTYAASYWVNMEVNSRWRGIVTGLRIDPARNCSPYRADSDWIYEISLVSSSR